MERPESKSDRLRGHMPRSPVYYIQVRRDSEPAAGWVAVDVAEDKREAARIAAAAVRAFQDGRDGGPAPIRVIGSAELLRRGGQDAINRAAVELWTAAASRGGR